MPTRRTFLKKSSAGAVAPFILPSAIRSAGIQPNDRIGMGFIGMGKKGTSLLKGYLRLDIQVVAVCDVDRTRRENARNIVNEFYRDDPEKGSPDCKAYNDFRELIGRDDIDAVCIATPDHWHAIPTLAALRAGEDVYCEKPLTHNIHEAIRVMNEVDINNRVLQTGSMQRSMKEFRIVCELVRNGAIGKVKRVECSFGGPGIPCDLPEEEMEPGLDWDMWIGPAPLRPYNSVLSPRGIIDHFPQWRRYKEFGGGGVADMGAHHLDIAQWGLGMDSSGPVEVRPPSDPEATSGGTLVYANGIQVIHKKGYGIHFFGAEGEVKVNRGRFEFIRNGKKVAGYEKGDRGVSLDSQLLEVENEFLQDVQVKLYNSKDHVWDFLDCVRARTKPITNEQIGGRSAICCHLLNLGYYNRETIKWNPKKLRFANGTGKPEWLTREYRKPWIV